MQTAATSTVTYAYDHADQRVKKTAGGISTYYPNKLFEIANATSTKYIFAGDSLVAYVEGNGTATTTHYIHPDHLGSTNVVTNSSGVSELVKDYYPYGAERLDQGNATLARGFIGQYEDGDNLSYLNSRYYKSDRGQFLSQDPAFLAVGKLGDLKSKTGLDLQTYLSDPQQLNSYSYARNNPIVNKDTNGQWLQYFAAFFWPEVAEAPTIGHENDALGLKTALFIGSVLPIGGEEGAAKSLVNGAKNFVTRETNDGIVQFGVEYAKNQGLKMSERGWTAGELKDSLGNLVQHYLKHGEEVGAGSASEYYSKANSLINSVDNKNIFKINNLYSNGSVDYFDITTKNLVGLDKNGSMSTFHQVTDPGKLNGIKNAIKK